MSSLVFLKRLYGETRSNAGSIHFQASSSPAMRMAKRKLQRRAKRLHLCGRHSTRLGSDGYIYCDETMRTLPGAPKLRDEILPFARANLQVLVQERKRRRIPRAASATIKQLAPPATEGISRCSNSHRISVCLN
jgi:hypothetical protein